MYFLTPIDAVPDVIPGVGYADDVAIIAGALIAVAAHIKDEHKKKAKEQVRKIFGDDYPDDESSDESVVA